MSRLLIIGCGGVAQVAIRKCCQNSEVFTDIMIASRTLSKCDDLKAKLEGKTASRIETARVDADNVEELKTLIRSYQPDAVLNVALIPQTTSARIRKIHSGGKFMRSGAKNWDLPLTLIIPGSGLIRKNSRRQDLPQFLEAGLTLVSHRYLRHMRRNIILMKSTPLIYLTVMAEIMDIRLPQTLIRR